MKGLVELHAGQVIDEKSGILGTIEVVVSCKKVVQALDRLLARKSIRS